VPLFSPRASRASCQKHLTTWASLNSLQIIVAMSLLQAGVDTAVIALWLGHADIRSTQPYLHADMTIKQRALERTTPTSAVPGRFRPSDTLLAFLEAL
jgi:site-specific recombinase XerD